MTLPKTALLAVIATLLGSQIVLAQHGYWQQRADYTIETVLDDETHRYEGVELVRYTNNSPDTLQRFFFHLFNNAFQPGSMMDERSRSIADPDRRVGDRISKLSSAEQGYLHITSLTQDGQEAAVIEEGTIAVVDLPRPILPGATAEFVLSFSAQAPLQVRRSGRDNAEGVDYSMSQWYPKVVEYDYMGWHANPYVGREFHGVWGDFDVTVVLPKGQKFAGTGYPREADVKSLDKRTRRALKKGRLVAHRRVAPRVHDFTWAADPAYTELIRERADGTRLEFYFIPGEETTENWNLLPAIMDEAFDFINASYGQYPYEKYAIIQGGDGGMEYAMCTLITGERNLTSLVGVSVHELMHSWYQFILATNESLYPWMDEGFTSFASAEVMNHLRSKGLIPGEAVPNPHEGNVLGHARFVNSGRAEAISSHADHYLTNAGYGVGSYTKGQLFLVQLRNIIGKAAFDRGMLRYYNTWKFKHPTPNDFIRIMEKESGQELDWYLQYMVNTTQQPDFAVDSVYARGANQSIIRLRRLSQFPMPLDVEIADTNGETATYLVPTVIQRGHAPLEGRTLAADWPWTNQTYELELPIPPSRIRQIVLDPALKISEASRDNNYYPPITPEQGEQ